MAISVEDKAKIAANQKYIDKHKDEILKEFAPAFCFGSGEDSFPMDAEEYVRDVVMAKYKHYSKNQSKLTPEEHEEYADIRQFFVDDRGNFIQDYQSRPGFAEFQAKLADDGKLPRKDRKHDGFLIFDEKKYGYALGSQVPIKGVHPNDKEGKKAPIYTSIIPTPDGFRVKYDYFYAISSAIPGTKWLYNLLPHKLSAKADHFAVHAGDWEGVEINTKFNPETGNPELSGMQTFAHGRDGARTVDLQDLTLNKDGRACVFVGEQTHPSYVDDFVGRCKFADRVGHKYEIVPDKFVNMGPDAKEHELPQFVKAGFNRQGDTAHMRIPSQAHAVDHKEYLEKSKEWNRYKPKLFFTKLYNKIKNKVLHLLGKKEAKAPPASLDIPHQDFKSPEVTKERPQSVAKAQEISAKKDNPRTKTSHAAKHAKKGRRGSWKESTKARAAEGEEKAKVK